MKGKVFDIQRFSLDDGPGIRTVVFLQGCNLHCPWCHNPESYLPHPVVIRSAACTGCGRCRMVCPQGALGDAGAMLDRSACMLCGACVEACPASARRISGREMETGELLKILLQDEEYYRASGGGVTFSGGEPTRQMDFIREMMKLLRDHGISCSIESNGILPDGALEALIEGLDYAMIDLKHSDPEIHERILGVSNGAIVDTIRALAAHIPTEVRTPVIPGFNDTPEALRGAVEIAQQAGASKIRFLPYHVFGAQKHKGLDLEYRYDSVPPMDRACLREMLGDLKKYTIEINV